MYSYSYKAATQRCNKNIINYFVIISEDSLGYHKNMQFSTKDADHDKYSKSCSSGWQGAWWYNSCMHSNLNGKYYLKETKTEIGRIVWLKWMKDSLKATSMKMRPAGFTSGEDVMPPIYTER